MNTYANNVGIVGVLRNSTLQVTNLSVSSALTFSYYYSTGVLIGWNDGSNWTLSSSNITTSITITAGNTGTGFFVGWSYSANVSISSTQCFVNMVAPTYFGMLCGFVQATYTFSYTASFTLNMTIHCFGTGSVGVTTGTVSGC